MCVERLMKQHSLFHLLILSLFIFERKETGIGVGDRGQEGARAPLKFGKKNIFRAIIM